ncbi:MAG: aldo/keto reductase [SAR202 cluster bacterium]|jgi:aryl-alcohol dehydrogenase-like predicted oxidoreductase|nr:MAG: aldo/keto reductase [SAR202 cluster bacterium]KAA1299215.1 MAG: aldo/keto reductase [SAR202 cluster bacterium]MQG12742.1 aldo/keto reductase [SAR202 cluster bacterium]|tara:strand:+ start:351 stop:1379 length:1029 start_codon:yes stop_codon:yes gene_type:complete
MNYRNLGNSGILVSEIGLGTNNFGRKLNYKESEVIIKSTLDHGINLLDTADMYSNGLSEEYIGKATKENRDQYIIASKGGMNPMPSPTDTKVAQRVNEGPNKSGLSSVHIKRSVDESLKRLQTDYIDLYQTHIFDPFTRQEETLKALDDLVTQGKIRYIGCSNYMAFELVEGIHISRKYGWAEFATIQPEFSMFEREPESELIHACDKYNVGILPYFPLASGFLTGKYKRNLIPEDGRLAGGNTAWSEKWLNDENFEIIENLELWANNKGITMVQLAFAWLLSKRSVSSVIAGATKVEQVKSNSEASGVELSNNDLEEIDKILPQTNKAGIGNLPRRIQNTP